MSLFIAASLLQPTANLPSISFCLLREEEVMAEQRLSAIADRLEKAVTRMESLGKLGPSGGGTEVNSKRRDH